MYSKFLLERYKGLYSEEEIERLDSPLEQSIRINTLRTTEEKLVSRLEKKAIVLEKIPWTKHGYFIEKAPFSVGATTEYLLGYYFIQDPASMYACEVLNPDKGEIVLDMAAAPGGKTSYLAQLMENRGVIIAVELNRQRMKSLRSNISRMGVENVIAIRMDALKVGELGVEFDKILLDAPCTGTGTISKNPEAVKKDEKDVATCTATQKSLFEAAHKVLKENGTLVYSACSFLPEEGEFVVQYAVDELGFRLEEVPFGAEAFIECYGTKLSEEMGKAKRFYPHVHGAQGFFIVKLVR
ncbi:MAG: RsmB/NOP family class I SAM-dependent RNA methyltransferase [Candidatus Hydrothermarchaeaceae archaeon]